MIQRDVDLFALDISATLRVHDGKLDIGHVRNGKWATET